MDHDNTSAANALSRLETALGVARRLGRHGIPVMYLDADEPATIVVDCTYWQCVVGALGVEPIYMRGGVPPAVVYGTIVLGDVEVHSHCKAAEAVHAFGVDADALGAPAMSAPCSACDGEGRVDQVDLEQVRPTTISPPYMVVTCPDCCGTGKVIICPECGHRGQDCEPCDCLEASAS